MKPIVQKKPVTKPEPKKSVWDKIVDTTMDLGQKSLNYAKEKSNPLNKDNYTPAGRVKVLKDSFSTKKK